VKRLSHPGRLGLVLVFVMAGLLLGCQQRGRRRIPSNSTAPEPAAQSPNRGQPAGEPASAAPGKATGKTGSAAAARKVPAGKMVAIQIELPAPAFRGTPKPGTEPHVEKPLGKPRPPFFAPEGTVNLARGKPVTTSDLVPLAGEVDYVTDGDKEASDFGCLELHPGRQWVQIDLGQKSAIYAVVVWHNHAEARVYRDVIVQVSDDPDFLDAQTVFNNDYDNSSGMGVGPDMGYVETSEGKLIDCQGVEGRYVRLWSNGNHIDDKNHYTEVEVYGRPVQ
jgi:hypothetical protein